ncbi:APC family permease [uncultured Clostridium sp.]|uniref:APC family permease n=1 Tax=uncultured Clostridium sp. TaxID=59620 RepID=UPI00263A09C8|nr:APC family permease [uncultured Clostridium sp.]
MEKSKRHKIGLWSMILLGFNSIVGTGIFLLPNKAMKLMGTASLLVILFDAALAVAVALCFAEAGSMFSKGGGPYLYTKKAFGDFPAFEVGIMTYAVCIIAAATMAVGFSTALSVFWPAAAHGLTKDIIVISVIVVLTIINLIGVNFTKIILNVATIGKLVPLVLFIAVGIFFIKGSNFTPILPHNTYVSGSFGTAALLIFFAFTGFESLALGAEDMENPKKNIPRAIIIVMAIVAAVYMLIQIVSIGMLGQGLANDLTPVSTATQRFLGPFGADFISIGILVSIIGINVAQSFYTPRIAKSLADDGLLPKPMAKMSKRNVPYIGIIVSAIITIPIALSGSFTELAVISSISRFAQYLPTCVAILVLRRKKDLNATFRIPFGPIIPIVASVVSIWLVLQSSLKNIVWGLGALVIAVPLYFIMRKYNKQEEIKE